MRRFLRWMSKAFTRIDLWIRQIENHEAIVGSWIIDIERAIARASDQLVWLQQAGTRQRRQLEELELEAEVLREEARTSPREDAYRLDCIRQARIVDGRMAPLRRTLREHGQTEAQLRGDIDRMRESLASLQNLHALMRTRQSRAEAMERFRGDGDGIAAAQDVVERWELHLSELEKRTPGRVDPADELIREALSKEEEISLRAELASLVAREGEANV